MKTTILWFRRDLRLHDNPALNWVLQNSESILPVYIYAADEEHPWEPGGASRWWLHHSLLELDQQLKSYGLKLNFYSGCSAKIIADLIKQTDADTLAYNKLYEPHLIERDEQLNQQLADKVEIKDFDAGLFFRPGTLLNNQQLPYRVYTPFYKKARPLINQFYDEYSVRSVKNKLKKIDLTTVKADHGISKLKLLDDHLWHEKLSAYWQPGEQAALKLADDFIDGPIIHYQTDRDFPAISGTSQLSAHLHFGEITPQQIYLSVLPLFRSGLDASSVASAEVFVKQLVWREFAHHVLWHFPHTSEKPMDPRYKASFWRKSKKDFEQWTKGQTGIPIVDAGMKQLWETGWMHNRVRMIVSSFLTKNLGLSWTQGAHWFWDTLIDANLANNSMGWQWVAGCGVDAAPYYRVFNPTTQTKRFDLKLNYITQWAPEHADLDYPTPMVDLAESREQALIRYKESINS